MGQVRVNAAPEMNAAASLVARREVRWAGAALALGATLFVLGIILGLWAFDGNWDTSLGPTLPQTAALIHERWSSFRVIWLGELLGSLLMAVAAFLLLRRPLSPPGWLPLSVAWIVVAVGSTILAASYSLTLGGFPPALAVFEEQPALFATLRGGVLFLHMIGSILQLLGLLAVLATEFRWRGRSPADRLIQAGAAVVAAGIAAAAGGLVPGEFSAAAIFLAAALLGLAIWLGAAAPAASGRDLA
jgi:hypothetical protein